ncbi:MAG TPA: hypothetical protein VG267_18870 [Terracidiphilus sp.]|nr:hypothetical protein [Terracidiphilus sp.]
MSATRGGLGNYDELEPDDGFEAESLVEADLVSVVAGFDSAGFDSAGFVSPAGAASAEILSALPLAAGFAA